MAKSRKDTLAEELLRFGRQAKQGATFGFADEAEDALAAALAYPFTRDTGMSYADLLGETRESSREQLAEDRKSPFVSLGGQIAGGVPLGLSKAGLSAANWVRGGSALSGIGRGAAVGAGYGGAAGLGAADDTLADRAGGFGLGAALGGVVGGATAPLARLGGSKDIDYRKVTKQTAKGFENKAQKELARQLSARPDLAQQLARAETMSGSAQRSGIPLTLAETIAQSSSDPLLALQAVIASNPMTAGRMAEMYAARSGTPQAAGQIEKRLMMLANQLDPSVGSYDEAAGAIIGQADKAAGDITRKLTAQARPLYDQAYGMNIPADDAILQNPLIISALDKVRNNPVFAQEIGGAADNSIQALDAVKRSLDDMAEAANRSGNRNEARLIQNARTQLLSSMDQASPQYGQARSIYSGNPDALQMRENIGALADVDPMNARKVGQQLFSGTQQNADITAQALGQKAPTAAAARIYGAVDELRNDPVNIASRIAPDKRTSDMLRTYAGGQYGPLEETLGVINQAKLGERMRFGSPTQPRQQAEKGMETAANAAIDIATGGKTTLMRRVAGLLGRGSQEADPQFYSDMADLMLTDQGMDLLRRVASGQQTAIQELQQVGLPSIAAGKLARATQTMPVTRAGVGALMTGQPEQQQSPVFLPKEDRMTEFDRLLQPQYQLPPQRFDEFDRILQGR